ncbi:hypothetical protein B296_00035178 [Ensete ventricosum]|uniref:Uncharacterized protein n=1 Tax=Ensete ventricosum TaxID=4639 RepID=A0A426ZUT1_ENSVE|nr:hypothetical protein B296_00035178 [Ensete ventricosum]
MLQHLLPNTAISRRPFVTCSRSRDTNAAAVLLPSPDATIAATTLLYLPLQSIQSPPLLLLPSSPPALVVSLLPYHLPPLLTRCSCSITAATPTHHLTTDAAINLKIAVAPSHPLVATTTINLKIPATISNQPIR